MVDSARIVLDLIAYRNFIAHMTLMSVKMSCCATKILEWTIGLKGGR